MQPINVADYRALAEDRLPPMVWDYYARGALDERSLRGNREAWLRLRLLHRVLRGVGQRSLSTTVLGQPVSMPLLVAPMAFQQLATAEGELATARAVEAAGSLMCLSTLSTQPMEQVIAAAPGRVWFQLYIYRDRGATEALVKRAEAAGAGALVVTVDAPVLATREQDRRNGFHLPPGMRMANLVDPERTTLPKDLGRSGLARYVHEQIDPDIRWADVAWLRSLTELPLVLKGVVHPDDARLAVEHGAAAVVVSNHGGRQLDGAAPTAEALPAVVDAARGDLEVYVDGGLRRGGDVLRALALGARAALVGRPLLWGLAVGGQAGAGDVLEIFRREMDETLALCGCRGVEELHRGLILS